MKKFYSKNGLTVNEIEALTSLTSPKLIQISFEVIYNGNKRIDTLNASDEYDSKIIELLSAKENKNNRAETYYNIIL